MMHVISKNLVKHVNLIRYPWKFFYMAFADCMCTCTCCLIFFFSMFSCQQYLKKNYRAKGVSNVISKLFEGIIAQYLHVESDLDVFQFGFKRGHSTALCAGVFKQAVNHYTSRGSHVFVCFVDFNKAYDTVTRSMSFPKLLDDNVNCMIVRVLDFWYTNQMYFARCLNVFSKHFMIQNGTRQGNVLYP